MNSKLSHRINPRSIGMLAMLILALAAATVASADTTKHVTFVHDVVIGGTKVAKGDYRLVIGEGHLAVIDGKHTVAQAPAKWIVRDDQADRDSVMFAHQRNVLIVIVAEQ
jgi:hypothetical protein